MTMETTLFTAALGLTPPWEVTDIRFDAAAKQVDIDVGFPAGSRFACPACGAADQPVHDTRARRWQHLHFFEHRAFIHAQVPRVRCGHCGKTSQVSVPWSRPGSGFSQLFEAMAITLCRHMPVNAVARLVGVGDDAIWRILHHHVETARGEEDFSEVRAVGVDETAARRGHEYITLFHDLDRQRVLYACDGRDKTTVARFVDDLAAHGGTATSVEAVCIDMSRAFIAGVDQHLPGAAVTFDRFHVIQLANAAVDEVRRAEVREQPDLKRSRWTWLKDCSRWTRRQIDQFHRLSRMGLKTARAWRLKERLREIFVEANCPAQADALLTAWCRWARRSRLAPFKKLALTLREHWQGLLNGFDSRLSNGSVEGMNAMIQAAKARARGYRTRRNLITMTYLIGGKLSRLPASPYDTTSGQAA
ncbi:MAG: ISL3 family transposase [Halothiobacillaceae bacterium]